MTKDMLSDRRRFYNRHLTEVILPYWLDRADPVHGGFYTCYDTTGRQRISAHKYVWSQGRCTWLYAKLADCGEVSMPDGMRTTCRELAGQGAEFLWEHCILPNGSCAFLLTEDGQPLESSPGSGYAVSHFADCFVLLGLARAGVLLGREEWVRKALELYRQVSAAWRTGRFRTAPDVLPAGWRGHAPAMILINTGDELSQALRSMGMDADARETDNMICQAMEDIAEHFMSPDGIVHECLGPDNGLLETLYGRHINPGHTNESMWFHIQAAQRLGREDIAERAVEIIRHTSTLAWDGEYGGMMYYLDRDGGAPHGAVSAEEKSLADAATRDWTNKLWWPHTETIYANLLCFARTGRPEFEVLYRQYHDYTFQTFPNPDRAVGEWIQLRGRDGTPCRGTVGGRLPVKDPYHITRNLILLIELLDRMNAPPVDK